MTIWLSAIGLTKEWNGTVLFENVDIQLAAGERAALFGRNGAGKTTLLRGLLGRVPFDKGRVYRRLPIERWGSLEQRVEMAEPLTALEYVRAASSPALFAAGRELAGLQERLRRDGGDERLFERYGAAFDRYAAMDGYGWETAVEIAMRQMKLEPAHWELPFAQLSGGQKTRAQLAAMTVSRPELIVLDEPTNHLDQETLRWLEDWIRSYRGTVLYVSHDREFIDRTAACLIELERGGSRTYPGGYTAYGEQKEREQAAAHRKQELERLDEREHPAVFVVVRPGA